jgi:hypothetical protein
MQLRSLHGPPFPRWKSALARPLRAHTSKLLNSLISQSDISFPRRIADFIDGDGKVKGIGKVTRCLVVDKKSAKLSSPRPHPTEWMEVLFAQ